MLGAIGLLGLVVPLFRGGLNHEMTPVLMTTFAFLVLGGSVAGYALVEKDRRRFGRLAVTGGLISVFGLLLGVVLRWLLL